MLLRRGDGWNGAVAYVAGPDAEAMVAARGQMGDEAFSVYEGGDGADGLVILRSTHVVIDR